MFVLLATAIVNPKFEPLLGLVAVIIGGAVVRRWPMLGMGLLIVLVASVFPRMLILVPAGPFELRGYEIVTLGMFALALVEPRRHTWGGVAGGALLAFLGFVTFSTLLAVSAGAVSLADAFSIGRDFMFFLVFFVVIRLFPERPRLERLFKFSAVVAGLTGVVAVMLSLGMSVPSIIDSQSADQVGIEGPINRVRLPGAALAYAFLLYAVLQMTRAQGRARLGWSLVILGMVMNLTLSFNRNMWVGLAIGLVVLLFLGGRQLRKSLAVGSLASVGLVVLVLLSGIGVENSPTVRPVVQRGTSLFVPGSLTRESSLQDRGNETAKAWESVQKHPVSGIGAGVPFGVTYPTRQPDGSYRPGVQLFLHNQYLYFILIAGIPALLAFGGFLVPVLYRGFTARGDLDVLVWAISVCMYAVSALVMLNLTSADSLTGLGLLTGGIIAATAAGGPAARLRALSGR